MLNAEAQLANVLAVTDFLLDSQIMVPFINFSVNKDNTSSTNAYYAVSANMIVFNGNILDRIPEKLQARTFCHEVEHVFQVCLHHHRWFSEPVYDKRHVTNATHYSHGLPFYPYTQQETDKFMNLISLGFQRVKKPNQLLQLKRQQLSSQQNEYLATYCKIASTINLA